MFTLSATNRSRQKVLGYPVDVVDEARALSVIEQAWSAQRRLHIVTLNAEMVVAAQQDGELDRIIREAHLIIPDGAGVVWAVRLSGQQINRLPGVELSLAALNRAAQLGRKVALIGARQEVLEKLLYELPTQMPGLQIVASHNGFFTEEDAEAVAEQIADHKPDLVLVALGVPKQEFFIDRFAHAFPQAVMVGVGGSFDVWAGEVKRAPKVMRDLHLEWLYRLAVEPWRWRRMGSSLPNFGFQVLKDRWRWGKLHRLDADAQEKKRDQQ
jgi:N-acetylglucosaminyldiphosphoundecaprenol N-acetyl-beta-D-mannosaminyltransferase